MLREWRQMTGILAMLLLGAPVIGAAQSSHSSGATYQWSGLDDDREVAGSVPRDSFRAGTVQAR